MQNNSKKLEEKFDLKKWLPVYGMYLAFRKSLSGEPNHLVSQFNQRNSIKETIPYIGFSIYHATCLAIGIQGLEYLAEKFL